MKKLILTLSLVFIAHLGHAGVISVDAFLSPDSVTIPHLETFRTTVVNAINSFDGSLIQNGTISSDALDANTNPVNFRSEAFNDWVYTGLLPPTSGTLASNTTAGTAYISGIRVIKDATPHTYTASKWTYVTLSKSGTYTYDEKSIGSSATALVADNIRLARVSTDGTIISSVLDQRTMSISLDSFQENFQRVGLEIGAVSPDTITIYPGVVYHGTTRIKKTTSTSLSLGTGGDWTGGSRATSTKGYVAINPSGDIKLTTTTPTVGDISGTTAGDLRYASISGVYWRILSQFWMDAVGSGNFANGEPTDWADNLKAGGVVQTVYKNFPQLATGTTILPYDNTIPQNTEGNEYMTIIFTPTSATNNLIVTVEAFGAVSGSSQATAGLFKDSVAGAIAATSSPSGTSNFIKPIYFNHFMTADTVNAITFKTRIGPAGAETYTFNGAGGSALLNEKLTSHISVTEIKAF